jgi:hypothetical protein
VTLRDDHGDLPEHARRVAGRLDRLGVPLPRSRAGHAQHTKFAERSRHLADHLRAAMLLSDHGHYASALVTIRTARDHHLIDRLLSLADRSVQVYSVNKTDLSDEEARLASLKAGPRPDIVRWWIENGRPDVLVKGLYPEGSLEAVRCSPRTTSWLTSTTPLRVVRTMPDSSRARSSPSVYAANGQRRLAP